MNVGQPTAAIALYEEKEDLVALRVVAVLPLVNFKIASSTLVRFNWESPNFPQSSCLLHFFLPFAHLFFPLLCGWNLKFPLSLSFFYILPLSLLLCLFLTLLLSLASLCHWLCQPTLEKSLYCHNFNKLSSAYSWLVR